MDLAFVFRVRVGEISVEKVLSYGDLLANKKIQCIPQALKKAHSVSTGNLKDEKNGYLVLVGGRLEGRLIIRGGEYFMILLYGVI